MKKLIGVILIVVLCFGSVGVSYAAENDPYKEPVIIGNDVWIGDNVVIEKAIVGSNAIIRKDCKIDLDGEIAVVASKEEVKMGTVIQNNKAV